MTPLLDTLTAQTARRDDAALVAACLSGDEQAWSELVDRYSRLIYSIPLRQGLGRDDAADIFQAVCLDLVAELPRLRDPQALPAWLMRATAHKVTKWKRRTDRYVPDDTGIADSTADSSDLPDSLIEHCQQTQALRDGIETLSERCRQMVHMLFFESPARPYRDVAQALGVATGSIGFLRSRCLDRLRSVLERIGV